MSNEQYKKFLKVLCDFDYLKNSLTFNIKVLQVKFLFFSAKLFNH